MGHSITAIILKGEFDVSKAEIFDLKGSPLAFGLTLFHIDHYYSACWQYVLKTTGHLDTSNIDSTIFPTEISIAEIIKQISFSEHPQFAIIQTDYAGGHGNQYASAFIGSNNADKSIRTINQALRFLGILKTNGSDEFDIVGLEKIRSQPDFLEKYIDLSEEYGI